MWRRCPPRPMDEEREAVGGWRLSGWCRGGRPPRFLDQPPTANRYPVAMHPPTANHACLPRNGLQLRSAAGRRRVRVHPSRDRRERRHRARSEQAAARAGPPRASTARARACARYEAYCDHVRDSGPEELVGLINALTTNVTSFFRENHHFEALAEYMLPEAMKRNQQSRRMRIWSAGCSTGEEPYCIAMVAAEVAAAGPTLGSQDPRDRHRQRRDRVRAAGHLSAGSRRVAAAGAPAQLLSRRAPASRPARRSSRRRSRAAVTFRALNLMQRLADARTVRHHLLPQRDDLFRSADARAAGEPLRADARARRLPVPRPFRIDPRRARRFGWSARRSTAGAEASRGS